MPAIALCLRRAVRARAPAWPRYRSPAPASSAGRLAGRPRYPAAHRLRRCTPPPLHRCSVSAAARRRGIRTVPSCTSRSYQFAQNPHKCFRVLRTRYTVLLREHKRRNRIHFALPPLAFRGSYRFAVTLISQHCMRRGRIQADRRRRRNQDLRVIDIASATEKCREQRHLQLALQALRLCPVQKLVGTKGIHHTHTVKIIEAKAESVTGADELFAHCGTSRLARPVLAREVLAQILALHGHLRIQLKRVPADIWQDLAGKRIQRLAKL